jgi:hypothetical protein
MIVIDVACNMLSVCPALILLLLSMLDEQSFVTTVVLPFGTEYPWCWLSTLINILTVMNLE